jgi:hypothetical protein
MKPNLYYFFVILSFISCNERAQSVHEVIDYCNEPTNGLRADYAIGEYRFEVIYRPVEIIVAQEIKSLSLTGQQIDSVRQLFDGIDYFLLRMQKKGTEVETSFARDPIRFGEVNTYLATKVGRDIKLVHAGDTILAKATIHTRTFGSSQSTDLLIAFESSLISKSGEFEVLFDDKIFGTGLHMFDFEINNIKSIPSLDLTKLIL